MTVHIKISEWYWGQWWNCWRFWICIYQWWEWKTSSISAVVADGRRHIVLQSKPQLGKMIGKKVF